MATLTYTIPIAGLNANEMIGAFALEHGWQPLINGEANPVSATEFSRLKLNRFIENSIASYSAKQAAEAARQTALDAVSGALGEVTTTLTIA